MMFSRTTHCYTHRTHVAFGPCFTNKLEFSCLMLHFDDCPLGTNAECTHGDLFVPTLIMNQWNVSSGSFASNIKKTPQSFPQQAFDFEITQALLNSFHFQRKDFPLLPHPEHCMHPKWLFQSFLLSHLSVNIPIFHMNLPDLPHPTPTIHM